MGQLFVHADNFLSFSGFPFKKKKIVKEQKLKELHHYTPKEFQVITAGMLKAKSPLTVTL